MHDHRQRCEVVFFFFFRGLLILKRERECKGTGTEEEGESPGRLPAECRAGHGAQSHYRETRIQAETKC